MTDNEAVYDREVAPRLKELAEFCQRRGMSFYASVEYDRYQIGETRFFSREHTPLMAMLATTGLARGDIDLAIMGLVAVARQFGIESVIIAKIAEIAQAEAERLGLGLDAEADAARSGSAGHA